MRCHYEGHGGFTFLRRLHGGLALLLSALLLSACGTGGNPSDDGQVLKSDKERISEPQVTPDQIAELADGNNAFALEFYQRMCQDSDGNVFVSPYSISLALAMTFSGARGDTAQAMVDVMHYTLGQDGLHPAFDWLDLELQSRADPPDEYADDGFKLRITNAVWGQTGYPFLAPFLDVLAQYYGAGLRLCDFSADPDQCRLTINDWVAKQTMDKIKDLLPPNSLDTLTRMVLTNAIYFKAAWNSPFELEDTTAGEFSLAGGSGVSVQMMNQVEDFYYSEGANYQAVELPYDGEQLSMLVIVPRPGQFETFDSQQFDTGMLGQIIAGLEYKLVTLSLPKFSFDFGGSIKAALADLGMGVAFSASQADFSGMTDAEQLYIGDVIHKAFVAVDEAGTEAAAATAVIMSGTGMPDEVTLTVDRPFIFLIRDNPTGTILFIGRVLDPSA
ncbi:MAG TPA: serpin family protein [Myxococcota bacterium]|nr:serpin family protein [Myxococcota bacterium]